MCSRTSRRFHQGSTDRPFPFFRGPGQRLVWSGPRFFNAGPGPVGSVTVMLVTSWCWWLYVDDWFRMLVAELLCWWLFSLCWWFSQCIKSVTNILNRSSRSWTCHQHIWSPTSVTNIDLTVGSGPWIPGFLYVIFLENYCMNEFEKIFEKAPLRGC